MPDVIEKLVELLKKFVPTIWAEGCDENRHPMCDDIHCSECIAERLIANGVTIQRWIPVTERLPDTQVEVLTYSECNGVRSAALLAANDKTAMWYLCRTDKLSIAVTHWMPLPEAPEEG